MAGQDPSQFTGAKVEFSALRHWLTQRKLKGFMSGLTPLQFCYNMVALKVCVVPTEDQLADFVSHNRKLGAFGGLVHLGFQIQDRGANWVKTAFKIVHEHLRATLAEEDSAELEFSPILTEHILCKLSRISGAFRQSDRITLAQIGEEAMHSGSWISGGSVKDCTGKLFPIGMETDRDEAERIITELNLFQGKSAR
ncbi:hypothetical protein EDB19DRAFT_1643065 [Suillus lakei]|nr:hypothetical protein EDB19DRAFT_1643065 [Suillus lakei]